MVKVGTILSGFIDEDNVELFIVASIGKYALLISTTYGVLDDRKCDTHLTILADKIRYDCFKVDDVEHQGIGWGSVDSENQDKRNKNEDKFVAKVYN